MISFSAKKFGMRLRQFRRSKSLNQRDFAAKIGTTQAYISAIETGKSIPKVDFIVRILAQFPELDLMWLIFGESSTSAGKSIPEPVPSVEELRHAILALPKEKRNIAIRHFLGLLALSRE